MQPSNVPERQYQVRHGARVISGDNHPPGKVTGYDAETLTVEQGSLSKTDLLVPRVPINRYDSGENVVYLSVRKEEALAYRWDSRAA